MKFVGAKLSTIKMPIILNSAIAGLFAGIISLGIVLAVCYYLREYFTSIDQIIINRYEFIVMLLVLGRL